MHEDGPSWHFFNSYCFKTRIYAILFFFQAVLNLFKSACLKNHETDVEEKELMSEIFAFQLL